MTHPTDEVTSTLAAETRSHYQLSDAHRLLSQHDVEEQVYWKNWDVFQQAILSQWKARWALHQVTGTYWGVTARQDSMEPLRQAQREFDHVSQLVGQMANGITGRTDSRPAATLASRGEIVFADGVPIIPSICPVVILHGSSTEMGYQYAQQIIEIYGSWIMQELACKPVDREIMGRWEEPLRHHAPELIDMAKGWAAGATDAGVPMDYWHALAIWSGRYAPAKSPAFVWGHPDEAAGLHPAFRSYNPAAHIPSRCSGVCAWGEASADGKLVTGGSHDGDFCFQATIVAFPDDGNNFIFTPFAATGFLQGFGEQWMHGFPGINSQGLAYVHHAGGAPLGEPASQWGYGLKRGATVFHCLRYANNARDALKLEMSFPVGDAGVINGSPGGFYADSTYAYALEGRPGAPNCKEPFLREYSFDSQGNRYAVLYANNNAISPRSTQSWCPPPQGYRYGAVEGYYAWDENEVFAQPSQTIGFRAVTKSSAIRNRYAFEMLKRRYGKIDLDYLFAMYRTSAPRRPGSHSDHLRDWRTGAPWTGSIAHRMNNFVAFTKPEEGLYYGCVGPAERHVSPLGNRATHGFYLYDETNSFWQLRLGTGPREVAQAALEHAETLIRESTDVLSSMSASHGARNAIAAYHAQAESELHQGRKALHAAAEIAGRTASAAAFAKAVRHLTRSHVRANQVMNVVRPREKTFVPNKELGGEPYSQ
jgi:hypothetical protein